MAKYVEKTAETVVESQNASYRASKLIAIDMFCGCGGLTTGLKRAGFDVIGAVELGKKIIKTYRANHRETITWNKDIRLVTVRAVKRRLRIKKGQLDLLAGCPPCQGFSSIRTLNGARAIDDPRNHLVSEFSRFVVGLRPKAVMLENVPELSNDPEFEQFCAKMKKLGYHGNWKIVDAADYGVPQRRKRLIYMAAKRKAVRFRRSHTPVRVKTVKDAIGGLQPAGQSGDKLHDIPENRTPRISRMIELIPPDGGSRSDLPVLYRLPCHQRCDGFKDVYGRMRWDDVAPTITGGCFNPSKGRFLHPTENRAITIREAALLQGFPRRYKFRGTKSKSELATMVGNAIPPDLVKWHAIKVKKTLQN